MVSSLKRLIVQAGHTAWTFFMIPYLTDKKDVLDALKVDAQQGLTANRVNEQAELFGCNTLEKSKKDSLIKRILRATTDKMILLLIFAGVLALAINIIGAIAVGEDPNIIEIAGIFVTAIICIAITVIMEGKSAKAFEALKKLSQDVKVKVIRDGTPIIIAQSELVVGDIVLVETGDKIVADGRLIECNALYVDESALTGESEAVNKASDTIINDVDTAVAERTNMLYSGCFVTAGNGKMIVTAVGQNSEFGKIAKELATNKNDTTPLAQKLGRLGKAIAIFGISMAMVVFVAQLIIFAMRGVVNFYNVTNAFLVSVVLIVAVVPEGLPTMVAVTLSVNIIKMSRQNALVKKLVASETVGCINVICSDKTGTLTQNKMTVTTVYGKGIDNEIVRLNFCVNSTADIEGADDNIKFIGNPTECALLASVYDAGTDYKQLRQGANIVRTCSFSSDTKNMTTVIKQGDNNIVLTKGSPEKILEMCNISDKEYQTILQAMTECQERAERVIAFAHKISNDNITSCERSKLECNMSFDGFVAISDPLRDEVYDAVKECKRAGIELKMLTGDNIVTASAIAKQLGLLDGGGIAIEAKELEALSDTEFDKMITKVRVIARSTPLIKMRIVTALKALGNVVAVTGDGINDAPALKCADVGIAMGIAGTEVSKEASDIVLLDDSFATITTAVKWGRGIYQNLQRFIQYSLATNIAAVLIILLSVLSGFGSPFTALQILWINVIMLDGPPALTLGMEPIRGDIMSNNPTRRSDSIISRTMLIKMLITAVLLTVVFIIQQAFNFLRVPEYQMMTALFTLFILMSLFTAFNAREFGARSIFPNLFRNKFFWIAIPVVIILQILLTQFGGAIFGTVPLAFVTWVKIIGMAVGVIIVSEIVKLIIRLSRRRIV